MLQHLPTSIVIYLTAIAALLGAVLGSAINCLALRIVQGKPWAGKERSACMACSHTLSSRDLIPVVSYLALKGRCRYCGAKLPKRYILTEGLLGLAFAGIFLRFGLSLDTAAAMALCACLLGLSLVDLDTFLIPDRFLVIPALVRLAQLAYEGRLLSGILPGLVIGGGVLALSLIMDKVLKKDTMGGGDIKLLFVLGLFFSLPECLLLVMISCFVGIGMASILMKVDSETPFPFGPALAAAAVVTLFIGEAVTGWYLGLFV